MRPLTVVRALAAPAFIGWVCAAGGTREAIGETPAPLSGPAHEDSTAANTGSDATRPARSTCSGPELSPTGWRRFGCDSRSLFRHLTLRNGIESAAGDSGTGTGPFDPGDAWRAAGIFGATGILYWRREDIRASVANHHTDSRTRVYQNARDVSKGIVAPLVAGGFWLAGKIGHDSYSKETAQIVLESTLYSTVLAAGGSYVLAAERPERGNSVTAFDTNGHGVSLDVALAASLVAPLDRRYLRSRPDDGKFRRAMNVFGRSALYGLVGLTALQRMDAGKHWAPDVLLGAAAGFTTAYSICSAHEPPAGARLEKLHALRGSSPRRPRVEVLADRLAVVWSY